VWGAGALARRFRPFGAYPIPTAYPGLTPWAAFLRRSGAGLSCL